MTLHGLLGRHTADPDGNRWENGSFVSTCQVCGRAMVKPPGGIWKLAASGNARRGRHDA